MNIIQLRRSRLLRLITVLLLVASVIFFATRNPTSNSVDSHASNVKVNFILSQLIILIYINKSK